MSLCASSVFLCVISAKRSVYFLQFPKLQWIYQKQLSEPFRPIQLTQKLPSLSVTVILNFSQLPHYSFFIPHSTFPTLPTQTTRQPDNQTTFPPTFYFCLLPWLLNSSLYILHSQTPAHPPLFRKIRRIRKLIFPSPPPFPNLTMFHLKQVKLWQNKPVS